MGERQNRIAERDALLSRIVALLRADERVCTVWLFGSFGQGKADEWSDLDIAIIVRDDAAAQVIAARREFVQRVADEPLLIQDVPQNAPPQGAYLLTMYPGEFGPHIVDWYWQPCSAARLPQGSRLIFDLVGIPPAPQVVPLTAQQRAEQLERDLLFFWMMLSVVTKKIMRRQSWVVIDLTVMLFNALESMRWQVGERASPPDHNEAGHRSESLPVTQSEQLALLRNLAQRVEMLFPRATSLGVAVPFGIVQPTYDLLDFAERVLLERNEAG